MLVKCQNILVPFWCKYPEVNDQNLFSQLANKMWHNSVPFSICIILPKHSTDVVSFQKDGPQSSVAWVALWGKQRLETGGNCQNQLKHNLLLRSSLKYCNYVAQPKNLPISDSPTLLVDRVSYELLPSSRKSSRTQSSHRINTVLFSVRVKLGS